jgi:glycosyltransferase involved in cell wall biosynthesis
LITYIIPVLNLEQTILASVSSAVACADQVDGRVIVCVNQCTDNTLAEVRKVVSPRVTVLQTRRYLSAAENFGRGLAGVDTPYVAFLSGDDVLDTQGQAMIAAASGSADTNTTVLYGDYSHIDGAGRTIGFASLRFRWNSPSQREARRNVLRISFPNLNGAWIPTKLYRRTLAESSNFMSGEAADSALDVALWWILAGYARFRYVPVIQVNYRIAACQSSEHAKRYVKGNRLNALVAIFEFYNAVIAEAEQADSPDLGRIQRTIAGKALGLLLTMTPLSPAEQGSVFDSLGGLGHIRSVRYLKAVHAHRIRSYHALAVSYQRAAALSATAKSAVKYLLLLRHGSER